MTPKRHEKSSKVAASKVAASKVAAASRRRLAAVGVGSGDVQSRSGVPPLDGKAKGKCGGGNSNKRRDGASTLNTLNNDSNSSNKRRDGASTLNNDGNSSNKRRDGASTLDSTLNSTFSRHERVESERFKAFTYEELVKRDKVNLDIFWLKDEALEESANLPPPEVIAQEIVDDLQAALEQFGAIAEDLK